MPRMSYHVRSSTVRYRGRLTTIREDEVEFPDGSVATREVAAHPDAVGAVAIDEDDRVVLLRQYRHPFGRHHLEIPAGKLDVEGEPPDATMRRELVEEVELDAGVLVHLVTFANSAGWNDEVTHVYLARDLRPATRPADFELAHEEADMEVLRVPFDEALAMVRQGEIVDAKTVVGLLAVADRRARGVRIHGAH